MPQGKSLILVGGLLVAAAAAVLLVADPFGAGDGAGDRGTSDAAAPAEATAAPTAAGAPREERPTLSLPSFDVKGPGAVRLRVLAFKDKKPLVDKPVRLVRETGETTERPTGPDGVVLFGDVPAGRNLRIEVAVAPFAPVVVKGVDVRAGQTTALDDLMLGAKVVLRGHVVDARGKAIPGAAVAAYSSAGLDLTEGVITAMVTEALRFPTPADEAKTDDGGVFELAELTPGRYRLSARRAGYATNHQADLVVAPDRTAGALKIVLGPSARVTGRVVDEQGAPVPNARVLAIEAGEMRGARMDTTTRKDFASTGDDGRYVIDTLNLGTTYRFGVIAEGLAPVFDTQALTVEAEQERDFTLARGGSIAGRVVDTATDKPVEGARVMVLVGQPTGFFPGGGRRGGQGQGGGGGAGGGGDSALATGAAVTDASGHFRIDGLRAGPVMTGQVKAAGFAPFAASTFTGNGWGEVVAGETLTADVRLVAGGSVTGRVTSALDGSPVPGAQVIAASQAGFFQGYPTASADADGMYRIDGIVGGSRFSVLATAPGFAAPDPTDEKNQLTMPPDGGSLVRDVALSVAGAVEGVVTTSRGEPVPGVRVRTRPAPTPGGGGGGGMWGGRNAWRQLLPGGGTVVLTDADGRFLIENVAADGSLVVEATSDDVVPSESEPFEVKPGQVAKANVVLLGGGTLRGRVVDEGGRPLSGAWVRAGFLDAGSAAQRNLSGFRADALLDPRTSGTTDADGRFELTRLRPGQALLKAEHDGYATFYRRDLQVQPDGVVDGYVITLTRGESIAGIVRGEDGHPVAGARVVATRQPGRNAPAAAGGTTPPAADGAVEPTLSDVTDARGRFEIPNVPGGDPWSVVVAMAPGHRGWYGANDEASIRRDVATGEKNVEFALKRSLPGDGAGFGPPRPPRPPGAGATPTPPSGMGGLPGGMGG